MIQRPQSPSCHPDASTAMRGVTLLELVVTIAIAAILLTIAVPSFTDLLRNNRVTSVTNELVGAVNLARSEATRRNGRVNVCAGNEALTACSNDWDNGWLVWADQNGDDTFSPDEILRIYQIPSDQTTLDAGTVTEFGFNGRGLRTGGTDNAPVAMVVQADPCNTGKQHQRQLEISTAGRVNVVRQACP